MKIIYAPENQSRQDFDFDPWALDWQDAAELEGMGGPAWDTYVRYVSSLVEGGIRATVVTLWYLLRQSQPDLRMADLKVKAGEVAVEFDPTEMAAILAAMTEAATPDGESTPKASPPSAGSGAARSPRGSTRRSKTNSTSQ